MQSKVKSRKLISQHQAVKAARTFLNTPFQHQGRVKGVGIDCIGLPIMVAKSLNLGDFDQADYPRNQDCSMLEKISNVCVPVVIQPGALLVFKISVAAVHCGIVALNQEGSLNLIHAWDVAGKVVEHKLTKDWTSKIVGCYGLPGVNYSDG